MYVAVLVAVLQAHGRDSARVVAQGCRAIGCLATFDAANKTALGAAGACEGE